MSPRGIRRATLIIGRERNEQMEGWSGEGQKRVEEEVGRKEVKASISSHSVKLINMDVLLDVFFVFVIHARNK